MLKVILIIGEYKFVRILNFLQSHNLLKITRGKEIDHIIDLAESGTRFTSPLNYSTFAQSHKKDKVCWNIGKSILIN